MSDYELFHGDCLDVMPTLAAGSVDLVLADLPYGTTACAWDSIIPLPSLWAEYKRLLKPKGAVVLTAMQPFTSLLVMSNLKWFRYCWYWAKERGTGFASSRFQPLRQVEEVCVFYQRAGTYNPQMIPLDKPYRHTLPIHSTKVMAGSVGSMTAAGPRQYKEYTHAHPTTLLTFPRDDVRKGVHSTQKPVALMEYLTRTHSNEGDTVLDNTMGSGTTGEACLNTGRRFIGIEKDAHYYQVSAKRLADVASNLRQDRLAIA